jgi:UDP-N-acetylglucosamine:LPS N-acetylglucosamine transferase
MGAGHAGAAGELADRLERLGLPVTTVDFLSVLPLRLGACIRQSYVAMVRHAPAVYDGIYRLWFEPEGRLHGPMGPFTAVAARRLAAVADAVRPSVVVSAFHVASQVLGELRGRGRLEAPVASLVVDFAVHRQWVHPAVDAHLCLHETAADAARRRGARGVSAPGPVVRQAFRQPVWTREAARRSLGVGAEDLVVLVVAGSWGVGDVETTARLLASSGRFVPVVVAGEDARLRYRLLRRGIRHAYGFVGDMARLMVAADVMVENAGGLTAMEAMAIGLPVVSFAPIPGHGRDNVARMAAAGVSTYARDPDELRAALDRLGAPGPARDAQVATARAMFREDAALVVARLAGLDGGRSGMDRPVAGPQEGGAEDERAGDSRREDASVVLPAGGGVGGVEAPTGGRRTGRRRAGSRRP